MEEVKIMHDPAKLVEIDYTNWEGKRRKRVIKPRYMYFGSTKFHPEPQWLLKAYDIEKKDWRRFTMKTIHSWKVVHEKEK